MQQKWTIHLFLNVFSQICEIFFTLSSHNFADTVMVFNGNNERSLLHCSVSDAADTGEEKLVFEGVIFNGFLYD